MNNRKKVTYIWAITLVIAGLLITSTASITANTTPELKDETAQYTVAQNMPLEFETSEYSENPLGMEGKQVTSGEYDDFHPSVSGGATGGFWSMLEYSDDDSVWQPQLWYSADGETWDWQLTALYDNAEFTGIDHNTVGTYATFGAPPDNSGYMIVMQAEILNGWVWDYGGNGYSNLFYNDMACYDDPDPDATEFGYNAVCTGDAGGNVGIPYVFYREKGPSQYGLIGWINGRYNYVHPANSIDQEDLYGYCVYDHNPADHLFLRVVNEGVWLYNPSPGYYYHSDVRTKDIPASGYEVMYPDVGASEGNAIIVAQKIDGSENDIICYYSDNGFSTYSESMVTEEVGVDELYPRVVKYGATSAICTYVKDDVLYYKVTTDGGETWEDEQVVSDNQVESQYRTDGLCEVNGDTYAVWEDNRGANIDIYFDSVFNVQNPDLEVTIQSGFGIGVSAIIKNIGDGGATNVNWTMTVTGGILGFINKTATGTIASLDPGAEETIKSGLLLGLGAIDIIATAECDEGSSDQDTGSGTQLIIFTIVS